MSTHASPPSDAELLTAARGGDGSALSALLERHQARVYRFGMQMCRDPQEAEDVLQDTLLSAARGVADFRGDSSLPTWLFTIARSHCIKRRRGLSRARARDAAELSAEAVTVADPSETPDESLARRELGAALDDAIGALDPMYREVLVLRDVEGLTAPEVAEVLGIGVDAVKSRLHRARLAVRARLLPALARDEDAGPEPAPSERCPDVLELYSRHLEGEIGPELCAQMEQHLAGCPRCQGRCDSLRRTLALCRTAPVAEVPVAVQESVRQAVRRALGQKA